MKPFYDLKAWPLLGAGLLALAACSTPAGAPPGTTPAQPANGGVALGADRDAHGCIASAGYAWCEREGQCVRPWELAASQGLASGPDNFHKYCSAAR